MVRLDKTDMVRLDKTMDRLDKTDMDRLGMDRLSNLRDRVRQLVTIRI